MTPEERCKKYRAEARRYKYKYLLLKLMLDNLFKEIVINSYDITVPDGAFRTVVDVNDVTYIFDKYKRSDNE